MDIGNECNFCLRCGLPVLPLRPAIMAKADTLPPLPADVTVPVPAQGDIAYTARLLRQGYLYIWAEASKRWINYFVTSDGYYYLLPASGNVPDDIIDGTRKPCAVKMTKLAKASLVTLPVKPAGMLNGVFWFCWSEVKWTEATRKKHESAAYYSRYMQRFDMDAWLIKGEGGAQTLPVSQLTTVVAEYSTKAKSADAYHWTPTPFKTPVAQGANDLMQASQTLMPDKGVMLVLQDMPALLQELSTLISVELQKNVYERPGDKQYARKALLLTSIDSIKTSLVKQFERDYIAKEEREERAERIALYGPFMYTATSNTPLPDNMWSTSSRAKMDSAVQKRWMDYEKFYSVKEAETFRTEFQTVLQQYNKNVVMHREAMYLGLIKSHACSAYFIHNFDTGDLANGIDYVQTLNYCMAGMQDKLGAFAFFKQGLISDPTDGKNILARALVLNQDTLASKIKQGVQGSTDLWTLPWSYWADAFNTTIDRMRDQSAGVMGIYFSLMAGPVIRAISDGLASKQVFTLMAALGVFSSKAIIPLVKTATNKTFIKEATMQLAKLSDTEPGSPDFDRLRHDTRQEVRRWQVKGLVVTGSDTREFPMMLDTREFDEIKDLPAKARSKALAKFLRATQDVEAEQFSSWQGNVRQGMGKAGQAMPFVLGVVSGILQTVSLLKTSEFSKNTLTADQQEARARWWAGVSAAVGTAFATTETGIRSFNLFSNMGSKLSVLRSERVLRWIGGAGKFFGVAGGIVTACYDFYHGYDEVMKGNYGLAGAYFVSSIAGLWLAIALLAPIPVIGTIIAAVILLLAAIYIAFNQKDNIQKWLQQCLWRRIPDKTDPNTVPVWPDKEKEMEQLKLAMGEG